MSTTDLKVDRSTWGRGPWDDEPEDRVEWRSRGLACLAVRGPLGAWCGYVGLPEGHPWRDKARTARLSSSRPEVEFQVGYSDIPAEVHGGLTYGPEPCSGRICHTPAPGESDDVRWIGFDCSHAWDEVPGLSGCSYGGWYKDIDYVRAEVERLAEQVEAAR